MLTGPQLARFRKKLLSWFAESQRDLPWRRTKDPYRIWLSEIMLQQTRVAAVIPYYERFLHRFPNVETLADAPAEEVLRLWAGLGYYSRARNLQKAARQVVEQHGSRFPDSAEKALALSGIGAYTSAAILSIAYGKKLAVLDGNVARVIARLQAIRGDLRVNSRWRSLQKAADAILAAHAPGDWNQAIMELGATVCTPKSPQCLLCPAGEYCKARKLGLTDAIPEKRNKRAPINITLASIVLVDPSGRTLLLPPPKPKRNLPATEDPAALLSRMWQFPTIQVKADAHEELEAYIQKTIYAKRKIPAELQPIARARHTVTYRRITLLPFRLEVPDLPRVPGARSLPLSDLSSVPISNLTRKVACAAILAAGNSAECDRELPAPLPF